MTDRPLFHRGHYNIIAKRFRVELEPLFKYGGIEQIKVAKRGAIVNLAMSMAKRFAEDNPEFDPIKFLDACSPNPNTYPISKLWESYVNRS